ncbi:hypothetical protein ACKWTF_015616 [Chironomus riparius]
MKALKPLITITLIHQFLYLQVTAQVLHYSFQEVLSNDYRCDFLFVSLKESFENATELSTPHLPDKTDDDVQSVEYRHGAFSLKFPSMICDKFKNLKSINMESGFVGKVDEKMLENCTNLEKFRMNSLSEDTLPENLFKNTTKLRMLYIFSISLKTFSRGVLATVNQTLTDLELSIRSDSFTFPSDFLVPLSNLRSLELTIGKLTNLPPTFFENSEKLEVLRMVECNIQDLPKDIFKPLINLQELDLSRNNLKVVHSDSFGSHPSLMTVDISGSPTSIDPKLYQLPSLLYVRMPISCGKSILVEDNLNGTKIKMNSDKCTASYKPRY